MRIKFFEGKEGFMNEDAVKPGIYIVKLAKRSSKMEPIKLYIGESYSMAQRCGRHLYETIIVNPEYFGLTEDLLKDDDLELIFEVYQWIDDKGFTDKKRNAELRRIEKEIIGVEHPIIQYKTSDRVLPDRVEIVKKAVKAL